MPLIHLAQNDLLQWLNQKNFSPLFQKETDQIYIVMNINGHEVPAFFGIRSEGHILQIIAYLPFELFPSTLGESARLLHILNKELDLPGFGMDEKEKLIFYRSVIPCLSQEVDEQILEMTLATMRIACETFMGAISAIISGNVKVDQLKK